VPWSPAKLSAPFRFTSQGLARSRPAFPLLGHFGKTLAQHESRNTNSPTGATSFFPPAHSLCFLFRQVPLGKIRLKFPLYVLVGPMRWEGSNATSARAHPRCHHGHRRRLHGGSAMSAIYQLAPCCHGRSSPSSAPQRAIFSAATMAIVQTRHQESACLFPTISQASVTMFLARRLLAAFRCRQSSI